jgi:F-type H+-transporting ATPase subunit epsilon
MKLKVVLPTGTLIEQEVTKITAEAENGSFCLLPHHVDFVSALVPGLLSFENERGEEEFLAIDEGVLVKCGAEVRVSSRNAVRGAVLGELKRTVEQQFRVLDERENQARSVLAKLEADLVSRFVRLGEKIRG